MVFLSLGAFLSVSGLLPIAESELLLHPVAEFALVILLFLDAAQTYLRALHKHHVWPVRMLVIGLPLVILLGTVAGSLMFPVVPVFAVALIASILAPTDAALGQAVVNDPNMRDRPKRAMVVESGLNDGLALPAVLLFASLTANEMGKGAGDWVVFAIQQIGLGAVAGVGVGLLGGASLVYAKSRNLTSEPYEGVIALAIAGLAYFLSLQIGGNGFIATFSAGLGFGSLTRGKCKFVFEFTESEGQLLAWASFLLLGAALVPEAIANLTLPMATFILLSLFVLRPLAIWISLIGTDAPPDTRLFFGWFGPRGLATALFALLAVEHVGGELGDFIHFTAINAVWISALLHGVTAAPGARWFAARAITHSTNQTRQMSL